MATTKVTFGSILGAVNSTANSVVSVLDVANTMIEKGQLAASTSLKKQRMEVLAEEENFLENLIRDKANEDAQSALRIQEFCKQSAEHAKLYQSAYERYNKILRPAA